MSLAPVALFVYNRPEHTGIVIAKLLQNELAAETELFVFADGPRDGASPATQLKIAQTRELIRGIQGFKKVHLFIADRNLGLAASVIRGVTQVLQNYERIIVLEDDIEPGRGFLKYMNQALELYNSDERVGCIHAWNYSMPMPGTRSGTFFLRGADCWGWATWRKSWSLFRQNARELYDETVRRKLQYSFDRRGTHPNTQMLLDQAEGKIESWAIRWNSSLFLAGKFCLHPVRPIVRNIGLDGSGTHSGVDDLKQAEPVHYIEVKRIPVRESAEFFRAFHRFCNRGFVQRNKIWMAGLFKRIFTF